MEKTRILYVSQQMLPYTPETDMAKVARQLPQGIQEAGKEIRAFMPRFGCINERRHQLHEVIRLSGMNLIVDDADHPLIIKVASIQAAKMQVYFIDNEEYYKRKAVLEDADGKFYADNDERAIFYCRGVLETVKKLGWKPDIVHCHGWFTATLPALLKTAYKEDPIFEGTKVVYSVYNDEFKGSLNKNYIKKAEFNELTAETLKVAEKPTHASVINAGLKYADAVVQGSETINKEIEQYISGLSVPVLGYQKEEELVEAYDAFYNEVLEENAVLVE